VQATIRGLKKGLVKQEDQIAHWRAGGEMTTRDIMKKVTEAENSIIEDFSDRNVKQFIPSVYIDRDFTTNKKEKAPSRGFGFADFTHHAHALACLRELNNNTAYSSEFVAGGKKAMDMKKARRIKQLSKGDFVNEDGKVLVPRLIVDFVVENKAKARKQIENREKQQANSEKQRLEQKEKKVVVKKTKKKKSRGAIQREKKRKNIEEGGDKSSEKNVQEMQELEDKQEVKPRESMQVTKKVKPLKPKKKRKVDAEDDHFENLVKSYTETFSKSSKESTGTGENAAGKIQPSKTAEKRWFD